jgi:hypothetical protein
MCALLACSADRAPARTTAPPAPAVLEVKETRDAAPPAAPEDPAVARQVRHDADVAVETLAKKLLAIEEECRLRVPEPEKACDDDATWAGIAKAYEAHYGTHEDARHDEGRIDALPRLGGRDVSPDDLAGRIRFACEERCGVARRIALAESEARKIADLAPKKPKPKTRAESIACLKKCVSHCSGGRSKVYDDGRIVVPDDEWCGTCEYSCRADCAVTTR